MPSNLLDIHVALNPKRSYLELAKNERDHRNWLACKRPLLVAFVIACAMVLIASAPLDVLLILSAMIYWSVVPVSELVALLVVMPPHPKFKKPQLIDLFFAGHAPWLISIVILAGIWSQLRPVAAGSLVFTNPLPLALLALGVIGWSFYVDYWYFRAVLQLGHMAALRRLIAQRFISWSLFLVVYVFGGFWSEVSGRLGL